MEVLVLIIIEDKFLRNFQFIAVVGKILMKIMRELNYSIKNRMRLIT